MKPLIINLKSDVLLWFYFFKNAEIDLTKAIN